MTKTQLKRIISEIIQEISTEQYYVIRLVSRGGGWKLVDAYKVDSEKIAIDLIDQHYAEEVGGGGDTSIYSEKPYSGELSGVTKYNWDGVEMIAVPVSLLGELMMDGSTNLPDITPGDLDQLASKHQ